jgi:hypothetical protein
MEGFCGARRLLFEATMGGRRRTTNFLMQATDIVARVPDGEIGLELGTFSAKRIAAAYKQTQKSSQLNFFELPTTKIH